MVGCLELDWLSSPYTACLLLMLLIPVLLIAAVELPLFILKLFSASAAL